MEINLTDSLNHIGLNHNEAIIYEALLSSGPTTILLLAKSTGIKRSTVYNTVDSLVSKGLVHHEIMGAKKLITAENPDQLNLMLSKQKKLLESILPRLQALHTDMRPSESLIKQFHGLQGIRAVYSNLLNDLNDGDDYLVISDQSKWHNLDPEFFEHFIKKRAKLNLKIKLLLQDTVHAKKYQKKQDEYNETIKLLPTHINLNINMVITKNKIVHVHLINPIFALVIENKSFIQMHRVLFNLLWDVF